MCSEDVQASVASIQLKVLLVAPSNVIPPPFADASDVLPCPKVMLISSTVKVVELMVVVVPLTVRSPERVRLVPDTAPVKVAPESAATFAAKATVPVASGNVIVLSAVGSVIAKVVSWSFAVAPSNTIEPSETVIPESVGVESVSPAIVVTVEPEPI